MADRLLTEAPDEHDGLTESELVSMVFLSLYVG
jgi:hypothetical protein